MSEIPFMQFYPGDYVQKTANLTTEQHGAYLLMLFAAWGKGGCRLPNNDQQLASIVRLNVRKWKAMKPIIMEFWQEESNFIFNKRQVSDYQKATEKRARRVAAGAKGGEAKSLKSMTIAPSNATLLLHQCSSKSEPEPDRTPLSPPKGASLNGSKRLRKSDVTPWSEIGRMLEEEDGDAERDH